MNKIDRLHRELMDKLTETNRALDRIASLLVSTQLLQECVSPEGEVRSAEDCAEIVTDSFGAGMCLQERMKDTQKEFAYQVDEFYISDDEDEAEEEEGDDEGPSPNIALKF